MNTELLSTNVTRNPAIDFIRGLCILFVILLHINILIPFEDILKQNQISPEILKVIFHSGYYGVVIFFVVSGFLITNISLKRWKNLSKINVAQFYLMRFSRIAPCLIGLLIILSIMHILGINGFVIKTTTLDKAIFSALTFHTNLLQARTGYLPGAWSVLWSLSVEEAFYLFFPLVCLFVRNRLLFITIMIFFIVAAPFARTIHIDNDWSDHSYLSCMDGIAIGCLAALYLNKFIQTRLVTLFFLYTGLLFFIGIFIFRHQVYQLGLTKIGINVTILEIGIAFILISTKNMVFTSFLSLIMSPLRWLGKNSYEIYLSHMFVIIFISKIVTSHSILLLTFSYFFTLLAAGVLGSCIANYFSEPLNRVLRTKGRSSAIQLSSN